MGFIENWRNGLARWFDGGQSNVQHASEISDEQRQKWGNDRADQFMRNYKDNYNNKINFRSGKNGDESYWRQNSYHSANDISPAALQDASAHPYIYEFTYYAPRNGGSIDDGEMEQKKGVVYMMTNQQDGGYFLQDQPIGDHYVYEATLDDGTTLSAKEFQDFVTANSRLGARGFKLRKKALNKNPSDFAGSDENKKSVLEYYNQIKNDYIVNPFDKQDVNRKNVYWDKQRRMWMAK